MPSTEGAGAAGAPGASEGTGDAAVGAALHYGSPIAEQRALLAGSAIVELPANGVIALTGADRLGWLDSITSQELGRLAPGASTETLLLDPSGRVEHAARVVDDGETTWLLVDPGTASDFGAFLERMRFRADVQVADRSAEFVTVGAFADVVPEVLGLVTWADPWAEVAVGGWQYAQAAEHPGSTWTYRETLVPRERAAELAALPHSGTLALDALRIAAWRPAEATERDATTLPHELDWLRSAVHLAKGCYRGQETVAKVHNLGHPPRRLVMLHIDGSDSPVLAHGDVVMQGDVEVGRVTSAATHHELGPIALALVKRGTDPAATLEVTAADGTRAAAAQELIVPPEAGATAGVPRLPRLSRR